MIWLYRILYPVLFLLSFPFYLLRMLRRGGYGPMLPGRFGFVSCPQKAEGVKRIWIQAVSVGEVLAVDHLVELLTQRESVECVITTTTSTGFELAKKKYGSIAVVIDAFPLDWYPFVSLAWSRIEPDVVILTEAELWPEHLSKAKKSNIPSLLINARMSDRSFRRLKANSWVRGLLYQSLSGICASSDDYADRLGQLGFPREEIQVTGNLKFDVNVAEVEDEEIIALGSELRIAEDQLIVLGASTWPGEEKMIVEACLSLRKSGIKLILILVPRHAERRDDIRNHLESFDEINWRFRSNEDWSSEAPDQRDELNVYVADTTGELKKFVGLSDIAVIGKSFPPHTEGQTPIEAMALGSAIIHGPSMSNFRSICRELDDSGGAISVENQHELLEALQDLSDNIGARTSLSESAKQVFDRNRGSSQRTADWIIDNFLS